MGVYIKSMKLPTTCKDCPMSTFEDFDTMPFCNISLDDMCFNEFKTKRLGNCPLVLVPPYGRLIDADALKAMLDNEVARLLEKGIEYLDCHVDTLFSDFKHDVDKMPTIIEAEEDEQHGNS